MFKMNGGVHNIVFIIYCGVIHTMWVRMYCDVPVL